MHFEDNFFTRMYIWEPIYISRNGIILIQSEYQSFSQNDESFHSHVELEQTWNSRRRRTELLCHNIRLSGDTAQSNFH